MLEILLSRGTLTVCEILVILVLVILLIRQSGKQKEITERREASSEKIKISQLDDKLRNPDLVREMTNRPNPFKVQYNAGGEQEIKLALPKFQAAIEVHSDNSVKRYLFDLNQQVTIGKGKTNALPIYDEQLAEQSCVIFMNQQEVLVTNSSPDHPIYIYRGKNSQLIRQQMVKLQSKDILTMGATKLQIMIYQN